MDYSVVRPVSLSFYRGCGHSRVSIETHAMPAGTFEAIRIHGGRSWRQIVAARRRLRLRPQGWRTPGNIRCEWRKHG
jgi:hypothetical protein